MKIFDVVCWVLRLKHPTIVANASTLAPAEEVLSHTTSASGASLFLSESIQLTESVISNLTDLSLTNISLFYFGTTDGETTLDKRLTSSSCKVYPGDLLWPNKFVWGLFNLIIGGRLITTIPSAASCYNSWGYDSADCSYVIEEFTDSYFQ